jgi:hypothetical protein
VTLIEPVVIEPGRFAGAVRPFDPGLTVRTRIRHVEGSGLTVAPRASLLVSPDGSAFWDAASQMAGFATNQNHVAAFSLRGVARKPALNLTWHYNAMGEPVEVGGTPNHRTFNPPHRYFLILFHGHDGPVEVAAWAEAGRTLQQQKAR